MMRAEINFSASSWYFYQLINNNTANTFTLYIYDGAMTSYASTTRKGLNLRDIGMRTGSTGSTPNNEHKGHIGPMRVTSGLLVTPALPADLFPTA